MCTHKKRDMLSLSLYFLKCDIWVFLKNLLRKFKFHENLMTGITCNMKSNVHFWSLSYSLLLRMRIFWDKSCRGNHNTHFMFSNLFLKIVSFVICCGKTWWMVSGCSGGCKFKWSFQRLRCCATNRKVAGSIPAGVSGFFIDIKSFLSHYGPGVDSASNRNEYQVYFLGAKVAGA